MANPTHADPKQDKALEDTFPASDPPANSGITGAEDPGTLPKKGNVDEIPTGSPTSDRYGAETAHLNQDEKKPS